MVTYNTMSPAITHGNLSHEQHTRNGTPYTNTTKANYMEWKRDIDRGLARHPDKLLSVVRDGTIDITRVIPLTHQLKAAGIDFAERRDELIVSYSEVAYYEIIATLRCPTTLKTLEREFGANRDGRVRTHRGHVEVRDIKHAGRARGLGRTAHGPDTRGS